LASGQEITTQLYVARLVSLVLYLASILAAYGTMAELAAPGNPLRWLVPVTLVFLPGYADLMTAVNNDVAAIAAFSLFLWVGTRAIRRGVRVMNTLGLIFATAFCLLSKETAYVAGPLSVFVLALAISHAKKWRIAVWGLSGAVLARFWRFSLETRRCGIARRSVGHSGHRPRAGERVFRLMLCHLMRCRDSCTSCAAC
jgi:hypothetical protein